MSSFWSSLGALGGGAADWKQRCVVKPNQSAGTDSVFLCDSEQQAQDAFLAINGHSNGLGQLNDGALVQVRGAISIIYLVLFDSS